MSGPSASRARVDTIPALLRPALGVFGYTLGALWYAYYVLQRATVRVVVHGGERLAGGSNYIYCHWHGAIPLALQCSAPRLAPFLCHGPHAWMQHPLWYMKPVHVLLRLVGVETIVLGSTGFDGRAAADELVRLLRAGYSTVVFPDGPAGPRHELKKGILHIARQSGVPIAPLRITGSRTRTARSWDRKEHPLPFCAVHVWIGPPIAVDDGNLAAAEAELIGALG